MSRAERVMRARRSTLTSAAAGLLTAAYFFSLTVGPREGIPAQFSSPDTSRPATGVSVQQDSSFLPTVETAARVSFAPAPVAPRVIEHGPRNVRAVALTFDACSIEQPGSYDESITDVLVSTQTPATLFLGGKWMREDAEQTKSLAANPLFELGNHSFLHPHLRKIPDEHILAEIQQTQEIMDSLIGRRATLFRAPYGEIDDRIVGLAASLGLMTVQYDLASGDPDPSIGKDRLIEYVSSMARNGSIIVMHINRRGWHTAEALPEIIARLRRRGFVFKTVSDLTRDMNLRADSLNPIPGK